MRLGLGVCRLVVQVLVACRQLDASLRRRVHSCAPGSSWVEPLGCQILSREWRKTIRIVTLKGSWIGHSFVF